MTAFPAFKLLSGGIVKLFIWMMCSLCVSVSVGVCVCEFPLLLKYWCFSHFAHSLFQWGCSKVAKKKKKLD